MPSTNSWAISLLLISRVTLAYLNAPDSNYSYSSYQPTPSYDWASPISSSTTVYGDWAESDSLDSDNFRDKVMDDDRVWVVAFIDPYDPDCQKFVSQWDKLKTYSSLEMR